MNPVRPILHLQYFRTAISNKYPWRFWTRQCLYQSLVPALKIYTSSNKTVSNSTNSFHSPVGGVDGQGNSRPMGLSWLSLRLMAQMFKSMSSPAWQSSLLVKSIRVHTRLNSMKKIPSLLHLMTSGAHLPVTFKSIPRKIIYTRSNNLSLNGLLARILQSAILISTHTH